MKIDRVPRIIQEPGAAAEVGAIVARHAGQGATVVLVTGHPFTPAADVVEAALRTSGLAPVRHAGTDDEATAAAADFVATLALWHKARAVVAVGDGAVLDVAKAAAVVAAGDFCAAEYADGTRALPRGALARVVVPVGHAAGREGTATATLIDDDDRFLRLAGDVLKPDEVVLDPSLHDGRAAGDIATSAADTLVRAVEAATGRGANAAGDLYAHGALRLVDRWLPLALERPDDVAATAGLQYAATLAGIAEDATSPGLCRAFAEALGRLAGLPGGRGAAAAALATLGWSAEGNAEGRFAAAAAVLGAGDGVEGLVRTVARIAGAPAVPVDPQALADRVGAPDMSPPLKANARRPTPDDLATLAARIAGR